MELAIRMNALISDVEDKNGGVNLVDTEELVRIDKELKKRLYKALGRKLEESIGEIVVDIKGDVLHKDSSSKSEVKKLGSIKFNVTVFSYLGGKIAQFEIEADTKLEANILAQQELLKMGLQGAHYKIS